MTASSERVRSSEAPAELVDDEAGGALLRLARETIVKRLSATSDTYTLEFESTPALERAATLRRGAFVTLTGGGSLRGCIGHIVSDEPLIQLVPAMAIAAATQDPRFPPVTPEEIDLLEIEVSVLTPPAPIEDLAKVEVGRHGLIARKGARTGLLLPQVPGDQGWDREQFIAYTCMKAGLQPDAWKDGSVAFEAFEAQVFSEAEHGRAQGEA